MTFKTEMAVATEIAKKAGTIMWQYFDGEQHRTIKENETPLTIADTLINRLVIEELANAFPTDGVIGEEESTTSYGMGRKWFCDPIDGTKAYTWGVPTAIFSLGLVIDGVPQVGVCYDPFLDRMYTAQKGKGAYCNGKLLRVSSDRLAGGVVAISSNIKEIQRGLPYINTLLAAQASLAYYSGGIYKALTVATGRCVGYLGDPLTTYDMAAVQLIVEEAGGKVTDLTGNSFDYTKPFKGTIVTNGVVHDELVTIVSG